MKRIHLILEGRVQGVGFRYFVRQQAIELGINGYVRNLIDGKIEIEAEASNPFLQLFIDRCKKGPSMARVDQIYQSELMTWGYSDFKIK